MERKDQWTNEDDSILAQTVLAHIRNGDTQLKGFQMAAERLERTPAACGFRWNSDVRKHYEAQVSEAKLQRGSRRNTKLEVATISRVRLEQPRPHSEQQDTSTDITDSFREKVSDYVEYVKGLELTILEQRQEIEHLKASLAEAQSRTPAEHNDLDNLIKLLHKARELGLMEKIS